MGPLVDMKGHPGKWHHVFGVLFAAAFLAVGAGVFAFLGMERSYLTAKPYDLGHAVETALGTFAFCFLVGSVHSVVRYFRERRRKP